MAISMSETSKSGCPSSPGRSRRRPALVAAHAAAHAAADAGAVARSYGTTDAAAQSAPDASADASAYTCSDARAVAGADDQRYRRTRRRREFVRCHGLVGVASPRPEVAC